MWLASVCATKRVVGGRSLAAMDLRHRNVTEPGAFTSGPANEADQLRLLVGQVRGPCSAACDGAGRRRAAAARRLPGVRAFEPERRRAPACRALRDDAR